MTSILPYLILLYLAALHTSMAAMEILSVTIMIVVLLDGWRRRDLSMFRIFRANRSLNIWLAAIVLAVLASLWSTPLTKPFWFQFGFMRWVGLLWVMTFALQSVWHPTFVSRLTRLWMALIFITGAYATLQCLSGWDFLRDGVVYPQGGGVYKAVGFFSLSMTLAYSLGLSTFAVSFPTLNSRAKTLGALTLLFAVLGILASMSRGAWIAAVLCVLFYLACERRTLLIPATLLVAASAAALTFFSRGFGEKILGMVRLNMDHSSSVRVDIWRAYWQMFLDHPLFGTGLLEGDKLLPEYYARLGINQEFVSHAHNNLLQWLAGAGLFGFVSYVGLVSLFLYKSWRLRNVNEWGWSLFLAQMFLQLGGLTESNFITAVVNHFLIFIWAMTLVVESRHENA